MVRVCIPRTTQSTVPAEGKRAEAGALPDARTYSAIAPESLQESDLLGRFCLGFQCMVTKPQQNELLSESQRFRSGWVERSAARLATTADASQNEAEATPTKDRFRRSRRKARNSLPSEMPFARHAC